MNKNLKSDTTQTELIKSMVHYSDYMMKQNLKIQPKKLLKKVIREKKFVEDPFFWNNGGLAFAINNYAAKDITEWSSASVGLLLGRKQSMRMVDNTLYYYACYDLLDEQIHDKMYKFLSTYDRDEAGSIVYRKGDSAAYLDTLGMVCPFLIRYGVENSEPEAVKLAMDQFRAFFRYGMDDASGLPYHGYDIPKGQKCGVIGWGRGLGWMLLGMCESIRWLDEGSKEYSELEKNISTMFDKIISYQKDDGSFSWQLQAVDGPSDSSVAGMLGYSLLKYAQVTNNVDKYSGVISKIEKSVLNNVDASGKVTGSSAECRGFSMYPQRFESNSWGQAFCTLFLIEMMDSNE